MALIDPPLYVQSDAHPARSFRAAITETWDEGVLRLTNLKVVQRNAGAGGPNFSVDVGIGRAVIKGDSATLQGNYMATNDAVLNDASTAITSAPSAGNHRKDLVILEMKDNAEDAGGLNLARIRVIAGTPTAVANTPVVPSLPVSSIALAEIGPITNSTTTITDSIIVDVRTLAGRVCTPGTIEHLAGTHIPNGWLECAGQTVSRTTYPDLFAELGTQYNTGGEAGTDFRLPLLRGKVAVPKLAGQAQVDTIGETGGEYVHTLTIAETPAHDHGGVTGLMSNDHVHSLDIPATQVMDPVTNQPVGTFGGGVTGVSTDNSGYGRTGAAINPMYVDPALAYTGGVSANHNHPVGSQGGGTSHNVMQPYQVVGLAVIRAL